MLIAFAIILPLRWGACGFRSGGCHKNFYSSHYIIYVSTMVYIYFDPDYFLQLVTENYPIPFPLFNEECISKQNIYIRHLQLLIAIIKTKNNKMWLPRLVVGYLRLDRPGDVWCSWGLISSNGKLSCTSVKSTDYLLVLWFFNLLFSHSISLALFMLYHRMCNQFNRASVA